MAIESKPSGGVKLTDEGTEKFARHVQTSEVSEKASQAAAEGRRWGEIYRKNGGRIRMRLDPKKREFVSAG